MTCADAATCAVALLYGVGFLLVVASVIVAAIRTPRAIVKMQQQVSELNEWARLERLERWRQVAEDPNAGAGAYQDIENHVAAEKQRRAEKIDVPFVEGVAIGSNGSEVIASAVRHVGRANKPTAVLGLLGGLLSTAASIWSLYL